MIGEPAVITPRPILVDNPTLIAAIPFLKDDLLAARRHDCVGVGMATKQQYEVFKFIFEQEKARESQLLERSKLYLSLVTFYSAFLLFVGKDLIPHNRLHWSLFALSTIFLLVAFLLSLYSAAVQKYQAVKNPKKILERLGDAPPTDDDFLDDRIVDLADAWTWNSSVNEGKAKILHWAGFALLSGMAAHAAYFLVRLWPTGGAS